MAPTLPVPAPPCHRNLLELAWRLCLVAVKHTSVQHLLFSPSGPQLTIYDLPPQVHPEEETIGLQNAFSVVDLKPAMEPAPESSPGGPAQAFPLIDPCTP